MKLLLILLLACGAVGAEVTRKYQTQCAVDHGGEPCPGYNYGVYISSNPADDYPDATSYMPIEYETYVSSGCPVCESYKGEEIAMPYFDDEAMRKYMINKGQPDNWIPSEYIFYLKICECGCVYKPTERERRRGKLCD